MICWETVARRLESREAIPPNEIEAIARDEHAAGQLCHRYNVLLQLSRSRTDCNLSLDRYLEQLRQHCAQKRQQIAGRAPAHPLVPPDVIPGPPELTVPRKASGCNQPQSKSAQESPGGEPVAINQQCLLPSAPSSNRPSRSRRRIVCSAISLPISYSITIPTQLGDIYRSLCASYPPRNNLDISLLWRIADDILWQRSGHRFLPSLNPAKLRTPVERVRAMLERVVFLKEQERKAEIESLADAVDPPLAERTKGSRDAEP